MQKGKGAKRSASPCSHFFRTKNNAIITAELLNYVRTRPTPLPTKPHNLSNQPTVVTGYPDTWHTHVRSLTTLTRRENASRAALCFTMSDERLNRSCLWHSFRIKSNGERNVRYVVRNASWYRKSGRSQSFLAHSNYKCGLEESHD